MRGRQGHGSEGSLQSAHRDRPQAIALIDDFALLGQTQHAANGAVGHCLDQIFCAPAAARRGSAAAVKNQYLDARLARGLQQFGLGHLQGPTRCRDAAFLVGIGIADHHHLTIAARIQMPPVGGFAM